MKDDKTYAEGPAGYNGGNGPGDAKKLPIKDYPGSHFQDKGKQNTVEGPCSGKKGYEKK